MKLITILLFMSASLLLAEAPPALSSEVQTLLKGTKLPYLVANDGTPFFEINLEDGSKEQVAVLAAADKYGNYTMRKVLCFIYIGADKPSDAIMLDALSESAMMATSRFQIHRLPDERWILSAVGLFPDSGDSATLKQLVEGIGITAGNFKKKNGITFKNEFVPVESRSELKEEVPAARPEESGSVNLFVMRIDPMIQMVNGMKKDEAGSDGDVRLPKPNLYVAEDKKSFLILQGDGDFLTALMVIEGMPTSEEAIKGFNENWDLPGTFSKFPDGDHALAYSVKINTAEEKDGEINYPEQRDKVLSVFEARKLCNFFLKRALERIKK